MSVFNWVKLAYAFTHSLTYPHLIHKTIHTNKTINSPINSPVNNSVVPASITLLLSLHTTHNNSITVKGFNLSSNKLLYINNITILQHTQNPPELKIKPCRTMLYFKAQNRLSKSRSYSIDIIIKRYN